LKEKRWQLRKLQRGGTMSLDLTLSTPRPYCMRFSPFIGAIYCHSFCVQIRIVSVQTKDSHMQLLNQQVTLMPNRPAPWGNKRFPKHQQLPVTSPNARPPLPSHPQWSAAY
jgi:hypothetical protein